MKPHLKKSLDLLDKYLEKTPKEVVDKELSELKYKQINLELLQKLPKEQVEKVFNQDMCDIAPDFLGFVDIYKSLSEIIPKHFTIIDLGCAYNPQCFFFTEHKQYIAVDISNCIKFQASNCIIVEKTIEKFIEEDLYKYDLGKTFAICSYVPPWYKNSDNCEMVRKSFYNLFVYYPTMGKGKEK